MAQKLSRASKGAVSEYYMLKEHLLHCLQLAEAFDVPLDAAEKAVL